MDSSNTNPTDMNDIQAFQISNNQLQLEEQIPDLQSTMTQPLFTAKSGSMNSVEFLMHNTLMTTGNNI